MPDNQLFSESEIADLVRRASELQEQGSASGYVPGVTRTELTKMFAEAGIEDKFLELAIQERLSGSQVTPKFKGKERIERVFPVEIQPEDFDIVTDSIKITPVSTANGVASGGVTQVGRSIQGQASGNWSNPYFSLSSRGGRTKLRVWSDNSVAWALSCLWMIPFALTPLLGRSMGVPMAYLAAAACVAAAFVSFRWLAKKGEETTRQIALSLETAILNSSCEASPLQKNEDFQPSDQEENSILNSTKD